jgi:hypothetical protein
MTSWQGNGDGISDAWLGLYASESRKAVRVMCVASARGGEASRIPLKQEVCPERAMERWHVQALNEEAGMKTLTCIGVLMGLGLLTASIQVASAFDCPNTHKAVMAYYDKTAGVAGADQTKLAQGKQTLDDAMKSHQEGKHKDAIKGMANALNTINDARP